METYDIAKTFTKETGQSISPLLSLSSSSSFSSSPSSSSAAADLMV
jgi:hypothetical protein